MGWHPHQTLITSVWLFAAAFNRWHKYNSAPENEPMTRDELDGYLRDWDPNG